MAFVDFFPAAAALDGETGRLLFGVTGQAFAREDVGRTDPVNLVDATNDIPIGTTIASGAQGWYPAFRAPGYTQLVIVSGGQETLVTSMYGLVLSVLPDPRTAGDGWVPRTRDGEYELVQSADSVLPDLAEGLPGWSLVLNDDRTGLILAPIVGGSGPSQPTSWDQIPDKPALASADHTQPVESLRRGNNQTLAVQILNLLAAGDAQAAREAIGAGAPVTGFPGFGDTAQTAMRGNKQFRAEEIGITPPSGMSSTDMDGVVRELRSLIGSGGGTASNTFVWRYANGGWPAAPVEKGSYEYVMAIGPRFPTAQERRPWMGNGPTQAFVEILLTAS